MILLLVKSKKWLGFVPSMKQTGSQEMHWAKLHLDEFDMQLLTRKKRGLGTSVFARKENCFIERKVNFQISFRKFEINK